MNDEAAASARTKILVFMAVGVLFALGIGLMMSRAIGGPLRAMQAAAQKLALGDVNVNVELDSKDELGALAESFREMTEVIKDRAILAQKIAAGDLTVEVKAKSEQDLLGNSFIQVVESLRTLVRKRRRWPRRQSPENWPPGATRLNSTAVTARSSRASTTRSTR